MPFSNYYVGSNLSDLGRNMVSDTMNERDNAVRQQEQQRLAYAQFIQAMQQREAQQQQSRQFQQELAFRGQGQQQNNAYQQALIDLQRQQQNFAQTGTTPAQEWQNQFGYAQLRNQLDIAKAQQGAIGQQGIAAMINQQGITARDASMAQETYDASEASAKAKAAQYNALLEQIEQDATQVEKKHDPWGWTTAEDKKLAGEQYKRSKFSELIQAMQLDKRPGDISPNPATKRFEPTLPARRPGGAQLQSMPTQQSALIQALQGTQSLSNTNAPAASVVSPGPSPEYTAAIEQLKQLYRSKQLDLPGYNRARAALDAQYGIR